MRIKTDSVISVAQAKVLLGDEALTMTDEEIQKMIEDFDVMAQYAIGLVQNFKKVKGKTD
jgi:predicted solute-binding protein